MENYLVHIEMKDGELREIMRDLHEATEKINDCYDKLRWLGVLKIEKADSTN